MKRKISIIIPVYNAEKYLPRCISSIISQNYENYEVIMVDDGSTDNSLKICRKMAEERNNFFVLHQKNQGVSTARNEALNSVRGEWIYFLDADDELEENSLSHMDAAIDKKSQWIVMGLRRHVEGTEVWSKDCMDCSGIKHYKGKEKFPELLNTGLFMYPCGKLYRKDIIREYNIQFPAGIPYGEDIRFNLQYFQYVDNYAVSDESAFIYHIRMGEGAGSSYYKDSFQMQMDIDKEILFMVEKRYLLSNDAKERLNRYFLNQGINTASAYLTIWKELPFSFRYKEIKKIMKDSRFWQFLETERNNHGIKKIDYWLLKKNHFLIYYGIHFLYTKWKNIGGR